MYTKRNFNNAERFVVFMAGLCSKSFIGYVLISSLIIYPILSVFAIWEALRDGAWEFWDTLKCEFYSINPINRKNYELVCVFYEEAKKELASSE